MKFPRFTKEEEIALHARMIQGDMEAKDLLARSILPWACKCALRTSGGRIDKEEIEGLAGLAIVECFGRWDPARGRLITAVYWSVFQVVALHKKYILPAVRIPATAAKNEHTKDFAKLANRPALSLSHIHEEHGISYGELLESETEDSIAAAEHESDLQEMRHLYQSALWKMEDARHIEVLLRRAEGQTLRQIGEELSISKARAGQIEAQAFKAIRKILGLEFA